MLDTNKYAEFVIVPLVIDQLYDACGRSAIVAVLLSEPAQTLLAVIGGALSQTCTSSCVVPAKSKVSDGTDDDTTISLSYVPVGTLAATSASNAMVSVLLGKMLIAPPDHTGEFVVPTMLPHVAVHGSAAGPLPLMKVVPVLYVKPS